MIAFHHGGPVGTAIPSREVACVIVADEVVGLASRAEPDYALLGLALEMLGLCDEDFDDLALEAVRGGKTGASMAARVAPSSSARRASTTSPACSTAATGSPRSAAPSSSARSAAS